MHNIFQSELLTDAALVRNLLVENEIEAKLIEGQSPYPSTGHSEVWIVNEEDHDRALELVRSLYAERSKERPAWRCAECRESNPDSFETCWRCRKARP